MKLLSLREKKGKNKIKFPAMHYSSIRLSTNRLEKVKMTPSAYDIF